MSEQDNEKKLIAEMGLPSWFTPEMLRPGVPVIAPKEDAEKTTVFDQYGIHERYPGAWGTNQETKAVQPEADKQKKKEGSFWNALRNLFQRHKIY